MIPKYVGIKGKFWAIFSEFIRKRDFKKYGTCISCGERVGSWKEFDAGHYIAAGVCGFALLFDEQNVNGQCRLCNGSAGGNPEGYTRGLDRRYGKGTSERLFERYADVQYKGKTTKAWNEREYAYYIENYKEKIKEIDS